MNVSEIRREIEIVERTVNANTDIKDIQGLVAKGVWEIALQLCELIEQSTAEQKEARAQQDSGGRRQTIR